MRCHALQLQSHPHPNDPIPYNSNHPFLRFSRIQSQTPQWLSSNSSSRRSPHLRLKVTQQPPRAITIVSAERKNQKRRSSWRKAMEKYVSFVAWNLRFVITGEPLDLILDDGGWGGGFGVGKKRKKGFGGDSERRWDLGIVGLLVWGWLVWLVLGRFGERDLGFRVLVSAVLGSWIRFWRSRSKWGLEVWCCVLGILILVVGLWGNERLERIVEGFRDRFSVLERALKTTRRKRSSSRRRM